MAQTIVIDNFRGQMTNYRFGDMNSGRGYVQINSGANPFIKPGQLTWSQSPVQIDPTGSVISDLIVAGKERVESNTLFVYAIGHTGRLYKIQVNDPTSYNPNYDNPVLLATLSINAPTFTMGGFMDFFGNTEQIYIGHDKGVTSIHFDGTTEAFVGTLGSWTQTVPRPLKQFVGKLYIGNGSNIAEIDSTSTVTSYTKLSPGFPTNSQVRDLDVLPDGNYLEAIVSRLALQDITSQNKTADDSSNSDSYMFKWNGSDTGYTAFTTFPSFTLGANIMFQNYQYTFGSDQYGAALFNPNEKILCMPEVSPIFPNAISSTGNLLSFMGSVFFQNQLQGYFVYLGSNDFEVGHPTGGGWSPFFTVATSPETDIVCIPFTLTVSNTGFGASSNGYPHNIFSNSKIYFSQLETSASPTTKYRFYKWDIDVSAIQSPLNTNAINNGIYQTQIQMFSKKITVSEVRIYGEPWIANNAFQIDLIGPDNNPITNGTYTFTAGTNLTIGNDYAWWGPDMAPTYALGVAITNKGTANHTINKIEVDYTDAGK